MDICYLSGNGHLDNSVQDKKSIPVNALNEPNSFNDVNNSLALGRQGQAVIGFSQPVSETLVVYEASKEKNIRELTTVEISTDGINWIPLEQTKFNKGDSNVHEYIYDLSDMGCIQQIRITDNAPSTWGDGFDIDAEAQPKHVVAPHNYFIFKNSVI